MKATSMDTTQCLARLVDDKLTGFFGDNKHKFHLELRCSRSSIPGTKLCGRCHDRPKGIQKNHPVSLHNCIDEPIPSWSHIFGGEWYKAKVSQYGEPSEEEMARGKRANEEATQGMGEKASLQKPEEKRVIKPRAPRRVSKKKTQLSTEETLPTNTVSSIMPLSIQAIESNELVLDEAEVTKIVVRKFQHEGTPYFINPVKQKLYSVGADGRPWQYVGKWNPRNETILTDVSDSD